MSRQEVQRVLSRALYDQDFLNAILADPETALKDYDLTSEERISLISRDRGLVQLLGAALSGGSPVQSQIEPAPVPFAPGPDSPPESPPEPGFSDEGGPGPFSDVGPGPHDDVPFSDVGPGPHDDVPFSDIPHFDLPPPHLDVGPPHNDEPHLDINPPHSDEPHLDLFPPHVDQGPHADGGHVDIPHGDLPHLDHGDILQHTDSPHVDAPHFDSNTAGFLVVQGGRSASGTPTHADGPPSLIDTTTFLDRFQGLVTQVERTFTLQEQRAIQAVDERFTQITTELTRLFGEFQQRISNLESQLNDLKKGSRGDKPGRE